MDLDLPTPEGFPAFPFDPPYEIQVELMRHLYTSIEQRQISIVESPTGTGKTLSLLCSSLTWLRDERDRARKGKLKDAAGENSHGGGKDWIIEQTRERLRREMERDDRDYEERLKEARKRENVMKKAARARVIKKQRREPNTPPSDTDDENFLPENEALVVGEDMNISPALRALMSKVDRMPSKTFMDSETTDRTCTKIYYASRTHSQLTQILPELQKLKLNPRISSHHPLPKSTSTEPLAQSSQKRPFENMGIEFDDADMSQVTRNVSLGSRKQLCINDELRAKTRDLDEGCRGLLAEKGEKRCQYLPTTSEDTRMLDFRDQILASPKDIEDLATAGRLANTCPYFGSRHAIPQAELVTLPYNLLLQRTAREALGIDLTDQIVVIDEAHNLIPTLLSISTTRLSYSTLATAFQQVCIYVSKFRNKLGPDNMLQLKRLVMFLDALRKYALEWKKSQEGKRVGGNMSSGKGTEDTMEVIMVAELLERLGRKAASVNLLEIAAYLKRSKVARKIAGYSDKEAEKDKPSSINRGAVPPLHVVEAFLLSLTGTNEDGRITIFASGNSDGADMKYQLLNPSPHFQEVVDVARSVILAGGTMSPISDITHQLFSYVPEERISSFSCGHIIPPSNLQTLVVSSGPRGGELEYKADKQKDANVIAELGQILVNFSGIVPGGMVVFFPSYKFLNAAKASWQTGGTLNRIGIKKKIFFEPEEAGDVEKVLHEYSTAIQAPSLSEKTRGALLFAVIGAKLSEGLNFSDDLARAVVVVGLPFANLGSPELKERMDYVKRQELRMGPSMKREPGQKDAAAELYENMCMNAVNQSIGRAIRHQNDWASLILLDRRYASSSIRNKLPKWIGKGITVTTGFGPVVRALGTFYQNKGQTDNKLS